MTAQALWYVGPGQAEIRAEKLADLAPGMVRVRALFSAVSRGTERLIWSGRVPAGEFARMRPPFMAGTFPFPVKYGYSAVGRVESGPASLRDRLVFALHPHQTVFDVPADAVTVLPDNLPPQRAVLAANMETALNALWDAAPGPADRIAIVGAGVVGALVASLCQSLAGAEVTLVDINPARAEIAQKLGLAFASPDHAPCNCDVVFHVSGNAAGLATALQLAGDEATVVEMSWHGDRETSVPLGGAFHSRRLRLISSQVGQVASSHRPRWSRGRRLAAALGLLSDPRLDSLLGAATPFGELPARLTAILDWDASALCPLISYSPVKP